MTLIIGILCTDGVVLGSDTQATYDSMGQPTIRQEDFSKLNVICDQRAILGVSGPVGLAQRIAAEIERMNKAKEIPGSAVDAMVAIGSSLWKRHLGPEMQAAAVARNVVGGLAEQSAICMTLLAIPVGQEACLFSFNQQGSPEQAKDNILFSAIGSGQRSADPFLAFLRRTFWKARKPALQDGIFATVWTLDYVIQSDPGGVGGSPRIAVLEMRNGEWGARHLQDPELEEHRQAVADAHLHLARFARSTGAPPPPPPPK